MLPYRNLEGGGGGEEGREMTRLDNLAKGDHKNACRKNRKLSNWWMLENQWNV